MKKFSQLDYQEKMDMLLRQRNVLRKVEKAAKDAADRIEGVIMGDASFSNAMNLIVGYLFPDEEAVKACDDQRIKIARQQSTYTPGQPHWTDYFTSGQTPEEAQATLEKEHSNGRD